MIIFGMIAPYFIFILIVISLIAFVFLYFIFRILEKQYPLTYQNLGCPKIFFGGIRESSLVTMFIFQKKYKSLDDKSLNKLCGFVFGCGIFNIVIACLLTVSFIILQLV